MATKKIEPTDKYANYRYKIVTPEELREAKWLIEQGDYKDMDDYIDRVTRVEIRLMKRADAAKNGKTTRRSLTVKKNKAA